MNKKPTKQADIKLTFLKIGHIMGQGHERMTKC